MQAKLDTNPEILKATGLTHEIPHPPAKMMHYTKQEVSIFSLLIENLINFEVDIILNTFIFIIHKILAPLRFIR